MSADQDKQHSVKSCVWHGWREIRRVLWREPALWYWRTNCSRNMHVHVSDLCFQRPMRSLEPIVALLPWCSFVCPSVCLSWKLDGKALWSYGAL